MNRKMAMLMLALALLMVALPAVALAQGQSHLREVRALTAGFHRIEAAQEAGYGLVPGLDHCFEELGQGAMGYHYINTGLLDAHVDPLQPEALVYAPGPNGTLVLGAVEYVVPITAWENSGFPGLPSVFGQELMRNDGLGIYALHVWLYKHNPDGIYASWNPEVSCP